MNIEHYSHRDKEGLSGILDEFRNQLRDRRICPQAFEARTQEDISSNGGLLVANDTYGHINGMLNYSIHQPKNVDGLTIVVREALPKNLISSKVNEVGRDFLMDTLDKKPFTFTAPIAYIVEMETFSRRIGIGTALINSLRKQGCEAAFLWSLPHVAGFYRKQGFKGTGVAVNVSHEKPHPVMIWTEKKRKPKSSNTKIRVA